MRGRTWLPVALAALGVGVVAGCAGGHGGKPAAPAQTGTASIAVTRKCGTARTAAGVPVEIEIERGSVACSTALAVERDYARDIASGKVPGNGGGAPVTVRGWVCRGFTTPHLLATGEASTCQKGGVVMLAVLAMTATPTASP